MCAVRWIRVLLCACGPVWVAVGCGESATPTAPSAKLLRRMGPEPAAPRPAEVRIPLILNDDGRPRPPVESTPEERAQVERLLTAIDERLAVMPDVARWKWNAKQPVEDPQREFRLLNEVSLRATELGVPERFAREFLTGQIVAARRMQQDAFEVWHSDPSIGKFPDVPDLRGELRPRIDECTAELLAALADVESWRGTPVFVDLVKELAPKRVSTPGTTAAIRTIAVHPLLSPRVAPEAGGDADAGPTPGGKSQAPRAVDRETDRPAGDDKGSQAAPSTPVTPSPAAEPSQATAP